MYWCNLSKKTFFIAGMLLLMAHIQSCRPSVTQNASTKKYFDLKNFFHTDSARLTKLNESVFKTVSHNNNTQSKKVHIDNWGAELSLFSESDINKPAWRNSYTVQNNDNFIIYKALDPELKTRQIMIKKDHGNVKWILIFNHTRNLLYETKEKLTYFPDSLYLIEKSQHVKLLGVNNYRIQGIINQ